MPLPDDRALLDKFNDRATSLSRESVEKRSDDKPSAPEATYELQALADKFNDRVRSQEREIPAKDTTNAPPERQVGQDKSQHAPATGFASGPGFDGPFGNMVRAGSFTIRQTQLDQATGGKQETRAVAKEVSAQELAELQELKNKFNSRANEAPGLNYANDRDRSL